MICSFQVEILQIDRVVMLGFTAQQGGDEVSAKKKEDGHTKPAGQIAIRHRVSDKDQKKSDGAYAIESGNVDGRLLSCLHL